MKKLDDLIKAFEDVERAFDKIVIDQVKKRERQVISLNTRQQLFLAGIDSSGQKLTPSYGPLTIKLKRRKNQPTNRVTLRDTGDFHRSFFAFFEDDRFTIYADDYKAPFLFGKYGNDVAGLTDDNVDEVAKLIKSDLQVEVRKRLKS